MVHPILDRLHIYLMSRTRLQDNVLLFLAGVFSALALPPVYLVPMLALGMSLWLLLLEKAPTPRRAFAMGWLFGFGYFIAGLYWIAAALFVDIARYWWVMPFAVCGLPFLMASYWGLAAVIMSYVPWRGWPKVVAFAVIFTLCEVLRGTLFTGFPWNYTGYVWSGFLPLLQSVSLFGIVGLSFLTTLLASVPYLYLTKQYSHYRQRHIFCMTVLGVTAVLIAWGMGRVSFPPQAKGQLQMVRIVQPNIAQTAKWSEEEQDAHRETLWRLSKSPANTPDPRLIVWPETAIALVDTMDLRVWNYQLDENLPDTSLLATGVLEADMTDKNQPTFYNRLDVFASNGTRVAQYSKSHLVPFGEFLPFEKYWPVKPPAVTAGSFSAGNGTTTLPLQTLPPFSPLVCYEVLFPEEAALDGKKRPGFLLNVTNDAWYGTTSGPFQHLAISRTRAVEQGLPLLRAANTGMSAVIDARGRMIAMLPLNQTGRLDAPLPPAAQPTLFARHGSTTWIFVLGLCFVAAFIGQSVQQKRLSSV